MSNWESALSLLASAAQTATGVGSVVNLGTRDRLLRQTLTVAASAGSGPSLTVRLEASADGATAWRTFATFTQTVGVTSEKISAVAPEQYVRAAWIINGATPSFTFGAAGTQGICFANLDHLDAYGAPAAATASVSATKKAEALAATTEMASGILAARYSLPFTAWGIDLVQATCKITAYDLLSVRGFKPDGSDSNIRDRYDDAMKWLAAVSAGKASPIGIVDQTPDDDETGVEIASYASRDWSR